MVDSSLGIINLISNIIILLITAIWIITRIFALEKIKSYFNIRTHKSNILNDYRLKRYDSLIDSFEEIITKDQTSELKALNKVYARMVLSAPDETLRGFLKSTKTKIDKETRNEIYFQIRKELQPNSKVRFDEIKNILYEIKKD